MDIGTDSETNNDTNDDAENVSGAVGFAVYNGLSAATDSVISGPIMRPIVTEILCDVAECNAVFPSIAALRRHKGNDHHEGKVQCPICFVWMLENSLRRHNLTTHFQQTRHPCTFAGCERFFTRLDSLQRHINSVHVKNVIYKCAICALTVGRADTLKNHMLVHTDHRGFCCDKCPAKFKRKIELTRHLDRHLRAEMLPHGYDIVEDVLKNQSNKTSKIFYYDSFISLILTLYTSIMYCYPLSML